MQGWCHSSHDPWRKGNLFPLSIEGIPEGTTCRKSGRPHSFPGAVTPDDPAASSMPPDPGGRPGPAHEPAVPAADGAFHTTRWTVVLAAQDGRDSVAHEALSELCRMYWYPLYAFLRRRGSPHAEAEDLTQAFFARLLEKEWLTDVTREGGRFRSFLLTSLKNFLANEWDRAQARKRGGGKVILSLNEEDAEERYGAELADQATPESLFERR